ncbi:MAG: hypothetical protein HQK54_08380 [Oligoflexales bacterium]|nr:hypothetical protein [Oligoflexales bacterium]
MRNRILAKLFSTSLAATTLLTYACGTNDSGSQVNANNQETQTTTGNIEIPNISVGTSMARKLQTGKNEITDAAIYGPEKKDVNYGKFSWNIKKADISWNVTKDTLRVQGQLSHRRAGYYDDQISYTCTWKVGSESGTGGLTYHVPFIVISEFKKWRPTADELVNMICSQAFITYHANR